MWSNETVYRVGLRITGNLAAWLSANYFCSNATAEVSPPKHLVSQWLTGENASSALLLLSLRDVCHKKPHFHYVTITGGQKQTGLKATTHTVNGREKKYIAFHPLSSWHNPTPMLQIILIKHARTSDSVQLHCDTGLYHVSPSPSPCFYWINQSRALLLPMRLFSDSNHDSKFSICQVQL